jgi:hypothetical protein
MQRALFFCLHSVPIALTPLDHTCPSLPVVIGLSLELPIVPPQVKARCAHPRLLFGLDLRW